MDTIKSLAVCLIMLLVMAIATGCNNDGNAQQSQTQFSSQLSGTYVSTEIDTNADGKKAVFTVLEGAGSLGSITAQGVGEWSNLLAPVTCPVGSTEATLVSGNWVLRTSNGDLIYTDFSSGTGCTNLSTGTATGSTEGSIIGGTGQFLNATGSVQASGTGTPLVSDPEGDSFGSLITTLTGTIITPD